MENLVIIQEEKALTTSLKVAEVFEKRHDNVVRDIENLLSGLLEFTEEEKGLLNFEESSYVNTQNKKQKIASTLLEIGV